VKKLAYISLIIFATSCFKKDEVLPAIKAQDFEVNLSLNGNQASYLDFSNLASTYDGKTSSWHLKFENTEDQWSIYLNTLQNVAVHNTTETDFEKVDNDYNILDLAWQLDVPTPLGSSPAIGTWGDFTFSNPKSYKNVYLVSWNDDITSYVYKLQILDASTDKYHIRYGTLDGETTNSIWISKSEEYLHSYFSFRAEKEILVEPQEADWNVCFTYLSDSISSYGEIPHIPTINTSFGLYHGMVFNQKNTQLYIDTSISFESIDFFYARDLPYKTVDELHNLFYEWDSNLGTIKIIENLTVILKKGNNYYALRAKDFKGSSLKDFTIDLESKQL